MTSGDDDETPLVVGSREQLLHLLAEAAEIEHTLMCSYLYAAFSLKRQSEAGLSHSEGEAVERWRKAIMGVAIEEMGHLLMVANLTVAVGGRPHFARPNFPVASGYFPSGVVVRLSGFSRGTIEHFIFLERPQGVGDEDGADYQQRGSDREQAYLGLMPSAQDYGTIGHLYDAVRANLEALSRRLSEPGLFVGGVAAQIDADLVELEGIAAIDGLAAANAAIDIIVEQGEGSPADRDESHYRSFVAIRDELDALQSANPDFVPAWPVADNPVLRRPPAPDDKVYIDDPAAAKLLDFACACYGLLLRVLVQSFGRSGPTSAADKKSLVEAAFTLMHALGSAAEALARLPAGKASPTINAGMSFTMLRGVEPFLAGAIEQRLVQEQLKALALAARRLSDSGLETDELDALVGSFAIAQSS